jgi:glycosyltransferase involved in cell wall biosynthesis
MVSSHLVQQGWKVTLFAFEDPDVEPYYPHDPAVRIVRLGMKAQRMPLMGGFRKAASRSRLLRKHFQAAAPDLIVSFLTRTNVLSVIAARGLGIPVIVSERNNPAMQKVGLIWGGLRRWTYSRAYGLITMTTGAMEFFPPAMRKRQWVIPNPAVLPEAAQAYRSRGRTIAAVGRLVPQKGFDLLVAAFDRIAAKHPDWHLVIWGEGPDREALEKQRSALGLDERISMPGVSATPGGWLATSHLFVFSSRFEGWGLVLGEAMAAGLPVISFDCQWGPAEMIVHERSGLLVANGDVEALAQALDRLCSDDTLRERLAVGARAAMQRFAPELVMQHWQRVISDAVPTRNAPAREA